jgi:hypothetical protein
MVEAGLLLWTQTKTWGTEEHLTKREVDKAIMSADQDAELGTPTNPKQSFTRYVLAGVFVILSLAVGFVAGRASVIRDERFTVGVVNQRRGTMLSEQEAIERAREWLIETDKPIEGRQVTVSLEGVYKVVFSPPPGTLGGDFTLTVDAGTGEILDIVIER